MAKTNKMKARLAKIQIRLGGSESSLCAQWVAKDLSFLHADSKDCADAKADMSLRWAHIADQHSFQGIKLSRRPHSPPQTMLNVMTVADQHSSLGNKLGRHTY